jgi:hypothetical protein
VAQVTSAREGLEEREIDRERQRVCVRIRARGTWTILGRGRTRGGGRVLGSRLSGRLDLTWEGTLEVGLLYSRTSGG